MRILKPIVIVAATVATDARAQVADTPLFASFKAFCVDTGARPNAVKAAVEAAGAKIGIPLSVTTSPFPMTVTSWEHFAGGRRLTVSAGTQHVPSTAKRLEANYNQCIVTTYTKDDGSIDAIHKWVGISPSSVSGGLTFYSFLGLASERFPVTANDDRARRAKIEEGEWALAVMHTASGASLQLTKVFADAASQP